MAKKIKQYSNLTPKEQNNINKLIKKGELRLIDITLGELQKKGVILNTDEDELLVIMNLSYVEEDDDDDDDMDNDEDGFVETTDEVELEEE